MPRYKIINGNLVNTTDYDQHEENILEDLQIEFDRTLNDLQNLEDADEDYLEEECDER